MCSLPQTLSAWVLLLGGSGLAGASSALPAETQADLTGPVPHYQSVLPGPQAEPAVQPWAQANAWVARFSRGHVDWLRAQPPERTPSPQPSPVAAPIPSSTPHVH